MHVTVAFTPKGASSSFVMAYADGVPEDLMVFVHGWSGSSEDTWEQTPHLLSQPGVYPKPFDVISFGYPSLRKSAAQCADTFASFIEMFLRHPGRFLASLGILGRSKHSKYRRVILMGHSLGAVVIRRALIDFAARQSPPAWLPSTKLIFFAPAHAGVSGLISSAPAAIDVLASGLGTMIRAAAMLVSPSFRDLTHGTPFLTRLHAEASALAFSQAPPPWIRSSATYIARTDAVVTNDKLIPHDANPVTFAGVGHISICKFTSTACPMFTQVAANI